MAFKKVLSIYSVVLFLLLGWSLIITNLSYAIDQEGDEIDIAKQPVPSSSQKQELLAPSQIIPGKWQQAPLLLKDTEVPDMPGARFRAFDQTFWLESGVLVFWAQISLPGKKKEEWGLFSLKNSQLRTVLMQGEKRTSTYMLAREGVKPEKINLYRYNTPPGWSNPARNQTPIHIGKDLLYLSCESGVGLGSKYRVFAWNGESLAKILGGNDELTLRGEHYQVNNARVLSVSPDGKVLIYFTTKNSRKTEGWVFYDGTEFTQSWMAGDPLPGMPGVQIDGLYFSSKRTYIVGEPTLYIDVIEPWISSNAILAILSVTGAPYKGGLFRLTQEKAEMILAFEQQDPTDPKEKISDIVDFAVFDDDTFVVDISRFKFLKGSKDILLLFRNGIFSKIFDKSLIQSKHDDFSVRRIAFLRADPPLILFTVTLSSQAGSRVESSGVTYYCRVRRDLFCFDGEQVSNLTEKMLIGEFGWFRSSLGYIPGVFFETRLSNEQEIDFTKLGLKLLAARLFLPYNTTKLQFELPPEFVAEENRSINLGDVVAFKEPGKAIVQLEDGFYLLTKHEESSPPEN